MWVKITLLIIALSIFITAWSQSVEMTINEDKVENKVKVRNKLGIYNTMSLLMGFPNNSFRTSYDKNVLWGFNLDLVFTPIKKNHFWQIGGQMDFLFGPTEKDLWNGIEVETWSTFTKFNIINRIRILNSKRINPFIELAYGRIKSRTATGYEVVDEQSFIELLIWEGILGHEDDYVANQYVSLDRYKDSNKSITIGIGAVINKVLIVQLKYSTSPEMGFVNKGDFIINNDQVIYNPTRSKIETITLSIGLSFEKLFD